LTLRGVLNEASNLQNHSFSSKYADVGPCRGDRTLSHCLKKTFKKLQTIWQPGV
jgi:hypothetical protein